MSSFGSTDSGYESGGVVEVFDEHTQAAMNKASQAKEHARHQQHLLASELSQRDSDDYQQDMLEHMLKMDVSPAIFSTQASQLIIVPSLRPCLMSTPLTFRRRFNGS